MSITQSEEKEYKIWFTSLKTGFEIFHNVKANNLENAIEKATRELLEKSPKLDLMFRFGSEIKQ